MWRAKVVLHFPRAPEEPGIAGGVLGEMAIEEMLVNRGVAPENLEEELNKYKKKYSDLLKEQEKFGVKVPIYTFHFEEKENKLIPVVKGNQILTMLREALNLWRIASNTREGKRVVTKKEVEEKGEALFSDLRISPFRIPFIRKEGDKERALTVDDVHIIVQFMEFDTQRGKRSGGKAAMIIRDADLTFEVESISGAFTSSFIQQLFKLGEGIGLGSMRKRGFGRFSLKSFEV